MNKSIEEMNDSELIKLTSKQVITRYIADRMSEGDSIHNVDFEDIFELGRYYERQINLAKLTKWSKELIYKHSEHVDRKIGLLNKYTTGVRHD